MKKDYLKKDKERVDKKLEELNLKYADMQHEKAMEKLEDRYDDLTKLKITENLNFRGRVLRKAYKDVIKLEKQRKR